MPPKPRSKGAEFGDMIISVVALTTIGLLMVGVIVDAYRKSKAQAKSIENNQNQNN